MQLYFLSWPLSLPLPYAPRSDLKSPPSETNVGIEEKERFHSILTDPPVVIFQIRRLRIEIEKLQWLHQQELSEMKHNLGIKITLFLLNIFVVHGPVCKGTSVLICFSYR